MGQFDSSKTRVAPVFDALLSGDATGASWLGNLLQLGSRREICNSVAFSRRLISGHGRRWGDSEAALPAPRLLLEHLVQNIDVDLVEASGDTGDTRSRRLALAQRDPDTVRLALQSLRKGIRGRKWFVLEGESRPDALLECSDAVVCIEGKRTELACTTRTTWMRRRSQLLRHMDAALETYPNKVVLGMLIVEGTSDVFNPSKHWLNESASQYEASMLSDSLPHRTTSERSSIAAGILGVTTWQAVCAAANIPWVSIPDKA